MRLPASCMGVGSMLNLQRFAPFCVPFASELWCVQGPLSIIFRWDWLKSAFPQSAKCAKMHQGGAKIDALWKQETPDSMGVSQSRKWEDPWWCLDVVDPKFENRLSPGRLGQQSECVACSQKSLGLFLSRKYPPFPSRVLTFFWKRKVVWATFVHFTKRTINELPPLSLSRVVITTTCMILFSSGFDNITNVLLDQTLAGKIGFYPVIYGQKM